MRSFIRTFLFVGLLVNLCVAPMQASAERLKDIATISGVRNNQLIGYGLVVGLSGTGDQTAQTPFTVQSLKSMLTQLGVAIPEGVDPQLKNVAAVMVHANLPPFVRIGQEIDITVSSLGNSASLRGGSLLMTPLKGADGQTYAIAQGNLIVGGFGASGSDGSSVTVNTPSAGRIPNGATVEREVSTGLGEQSELVYLLNSPDFTTANRIADVINGFMGEGMASPVDAGAVAVLGPQNIEDKVSFISVIENLEVDPAQAPAKVIINSRTGTVVIGSSVRVDPAAVAHGSLTVTILENAEVSQPNAFSRGGETVVTPNSTVLVNEGENRMFVFNPGVSLDELVRAVNLVGAAPGDLVAILEALEQVGALHAELIVI